METGGDASLPSRERELKRLLPHDGDEPATVAPLAGARIETNHGRAGEVMPLSLPSRERELKRLIDCNIVKQITSLPSRERELKLSREVL